ncbi:MAG: signal recognition particle protein Srp54 [Euryarchaeota archaeon]|nr:signal recognition particle protein Srp54 [Euryarchaeota archaeon]
MVLDNLGESLRGTLKRIANAKHIDPQLIKEVVREIQRALISADVNVKLVLQLTKSIERRALEEKPPAGMSAREHVVNIVHQELSTILGNDRRIPLKKQVIMLVGLYGNGKTTTAGKLSKYFQKKGLRPALIAGDVHRPAAVDQLRTLAEQTNTPFYGETDNKDTIQIVTRGLEKFKKSADVVIVDTAGRHKLDDDLIQEMRAIFEAVKPDEKFLVIDASVGQQGGPQAKAFNDTVGVTGVIITKLDGTAKGGGALSAVAETQAPVVFIGTGEHIADFEQFDANRFIGRLLGMGDIEGLLEKAQEAAEGQDMEKSARKMMSGKFTLHDMYSQMEMLNKMGPLGKVAQMLPGGMGQKLQGAEMEQSQIKMRRFKVVMDSMTEAEMEAPNLIKSSRQRRIARGAGADVQEVKDLLKYYDMTKRMMKGFGSNRKAQRNLMRQLKFQGGGP